MLQPGVPRWAGVPFETPDPTPSSIRVAVIGWTIFWGLWIVPGLFPLLGLPGMLVLILFIWFHRLFH